MSVLDPLFCIRCNEIVEDQDRSTPCPAAPHGEVGSHAFEITPPSRRITFVTKNAEKFYLDEETSRAAREVAAHRGITIDEFVREVYKSTRDAIN